MITTKIQKWGHSMALRIPAKTMQAWGVVGGQSVALNIEGGTLVATPTPKRYTLAELLAQCDLTQPVTTEDREWLDAPAVGLEAL